MKRFGLPKSCRLSKNEEYDRVYRNGSRMRGNGFVLVCEENDQPDSRLGISVRIGEGGAVRRNRIKRIVRETFRLHREVFPSSCDIVFAVRPEFSLNGTDDVRAAVARLTGVQKHVRP